MSHIINYVIDKRNKRTENKIFKIIHDIVVALAHFQLGDREKIIIS